MNEKHNKILWNVLKCADSMCHVFINIWNKICKCCNREYEMSWNEFNNRLKARHLYYDHRLNINEINKSVLKQPKFPMQYQTQTYSFVEVVKVVG